MKPSSPVSIVGFAGCTSLGYSLMATLPAMGAGLSNFTDTGVKNLFGTPVAAAALLDPEIPRIERLTTLARIGMTDLHYLLSALELDRVPFIMGAAADLTGDEQAALQQELLDSRVVSPAPSWFPYGRASGFLALAHAASLIDRGEHRLIVVGGIDSLCARETVNGLVRAERVLGPHVEGTIPGEAAVFALVARSGDPVADPETSVTVDAVVQERAPVPFLTADRVSGDGLSSAFRALRETGARRVDRIIAAHSGEGYFGNSFSHAYLREVEIMPEPLEVDLTADCVGDIGAATGILALAYATYLLATEPRGGAGRVLAYSESDTGEIGAAILEGAPRFWHRGVAVS